MNTHPTLAAPVADIAETQAELTVIIVSYNTRALTLKCLETLYANTHRTRFHTVVLDNASADGSAEAIAEAFPQVELIASEENLGFAKANNVVAEAAQSEWLLLLNPDTEVYDGAIDALLDFSRAHPKAGLTGGRTFFPDGSLNPLSCQGQITLWSSLSRALGLTAIFKKSAFFNPEAYGNWPRDTAREVDCIVGCFLMIPKALWDELGGFDLRYYMYGEDSDLSLRAIERGYRPMICPDARIMHLVGASSNVKAKKVVMVAKSRTTLIHDHWPAWKVPFGMATMWLWGALRTATAVVMALPPGETRRERAEKWRYIWAERSDWLTRY
ncbi:MAG: glycosyltransferase family 2 protein [Pseudomonadota bacterium]